MTLHSRQRVAIVGAGVIGLTTAIVLADDYDVTILAAAFGTQSDSVKATAIWHVYLVPETELVLLWAERTLKKFMELHATTPAAGIELVNGVELFRTQPKAIPTWSRIPPRFSFLSDSEIAQFNHHDKDKDGHLSALLTKFPVRWGYRICAPAVSMTKYLTWLMHTIAKKRIECKEVIVDDLARLAEDYDYVINCSGFGARELVKDTGFVAYKGQYFVLSSDASAPEEYIGDDDFPTGMAYVIPRGGEVLVGGSAERNVEDLLPTADWSEVVERAGTYVPWLNSRSARDSVQRLVVGVRPARSDGIRLERQDINGATIVHNYGHGGSGFSLSWGCAEEVARMLGS